MIKTHDFVDDKSSAYRVGFLDAFTWCLSHPEEMMTLYDSDAPPFSEVSSLLAQMSVRFDQAGSNPEKWIGRSGGALDITELAWVTSTEAN